MAEPTGGQAAGGTATLNVEINADAAARGGNTVLEILRKIVSAVTNLNGTFSGASSAISKAFNSAQTSASGLLGGLADKFKTTVGHIRQAASQAAAAGGAFRAFGQSAGGSLGPIDSALVKINDRLTGLRNVAGLSIAFAAVEDSLARVVSLLVGLPQRGVEFAASLETAALGIQAVLASSVRVNGEVLKFNEAAELSKNIMLEINKAAIESAASTREIAQAFSAILPFATESKKSVGEIIKFAVTGSTAIKALGLGSHQLVQELRDLVAGGIQPASSTLANALGLTDKDIKEIKKNGGDIIAYLMERLKGYSDATDAWSKTLQGKWQILFERLDLISARAFFTLTEAAGSSIDTITSWLPQLEAILIDVSDALVDFGKGFVTASKFVYELVRGPLSNFASVVSSVIETIRSVSVSTSAWATALKVLAGIILSTKIANLGFSFLAFLKSVKDSTVATWGQITANTAYVASSTAVTTANEIQALSELQKARALAAAAVGGREQATAQKAVAGATAAYGAAVAATTAATTVATAKVTLFSRALSFLGGPLGVIINLLSLGGSMWLMFGSNGASALDTIADKAKKSAEELAKMKRGMLFGEGRRGEANFEINDQTKKRNEIQAQIDAERKKLATIGTPSTGIKSRSEQGQASESASKARLKALEDELFVMEDFVDKENDIISSIDRGTRAAEESTKAMLERNGATLRSKELNESVQKMLDEYGPKLEAIERKYAKENETLTEWVAKKKEEIALRKDASDPQALAEVFEKEKKIREGLKEAKADEIKKLNDKANALSKEEKALQKLDKQTKEYLKSLAERERLTQFSGEELAFQTEIGRVLAQNLDISREDLEIRLRRVTALEKEAKIRENDEALTKEYEKQLALSKYIGDELEIQSYIWDAQAAGTRKSTEELRKMATVMLQAQKNQDALNDRAEIFRRLAERITDAFSNAFRDIFTDGIKSFKSLTKTLKDLFLDLLADMLTAALANPIRIFIETALGGVAGFSSPAVGGLTSQLGGIGGGTAAQPASADTGIFNVLTNGFKTLFGSVKSGFEYLLSGVKDAADSLFSLGDTTSVAYAANNKPRIYNADGSVSTERTITIEADNMYYNIPTIVNGRQLSENDAWESFRSGSSQAVGGPFTSMGEATSAAEARSNDIGNAIVSSVGRFEKLEKTFKSFSGSFEKFGSSVASGFRNLFGLGSAGGGVSQQAAMLAAQSEGFGGAGAFASVLGGGTGPGSQAAMLASQTDAFGTAGTASTLDSLFGSSGAGSTGFGASSLLGMAGGGLAGYGIGGAIGGNKTSSMLGMVGGAIGSIWGPITAMIGSAVGGLLGKVFGKKEKKPRATLTTGEGLSFEDSIYSEGAFGKVGFLATQTRKTDANQYKELFDTVTQIDDAIASYLDEGITSQIKTALDGWKGRTDKGAVNVERMIDDRFKYIAEIMYSTTDLIAGDIAKVLEKGVSSETFTQDFQFAATYRTAFDPQEAVGPYQAAIEDLNSLFEAGKKTVERLGLSMEAWTATFNKAVSSIQETFLTSMRYAIMDLEDPVASALDQIQADFQVTLKEAEALGVGTTEVTRLFQLRLENFLKDVQQAQEENLSLQLDALDQLHSAAYDAADQWKRLAYNLTEASKALKVDTSLTPLNADERYAEARRQFTEVSARATTGDAQALDDLERYAKMFLEESRSYYASSPDYSADFEMVTRALDDSAAYAEKQASTSERSMSLTERLAQIITGLDDTSDTGLTAVRERVGSLTSGMDSGWTNLSDLSREQLAELYSLLSLSGEMTSLSSQQLDSLNSVVTSTDALSSLNADLLGSVKEILMTGQEQQTEQTTATQDRLIELINTTGGVSAAATALLDEFKSDPLGQAQVALLTQNNDQLSGLTSIMSGMWETLKTKEFGTNITIGNISAKKKADVNINIGAYAEGGYAPAGLALVGERGPELVDFKTPVRVYNASDTSRMLETLASNSNVIQFPGLKYRAAGGVASGPTIVGEMGPELVGPVSSPRAQTGANDTNALAQLVAQGNAILAEVQATLQAMPAAVVNPLAVRLEKIDNTGQEQVEATRNAARASEPKLSTRRIA